MKSYRLLVASAIDLALVVILGLQTGANVPKWQVILLSIWIGFNIVMIYDNLKPKK